MKSLRAALILTTCLLLVPPVGWCCIVTLPAPAPATPAKADCCRSCCPEQPPQDDEAPTRAPMTVCCCENRVPLPDGGVKFFPDAAVAILAPPADDLSLSTRLDGATATLCLSPPRALHVLRCLWLC
jgi:hypothetical protein